MSKQDSPPSTDSTDIVSLRESEAHEASCAQSDRLFAWIFGAHFIAVVLLSVLLTPYTWAGSEKSLHPHVIFAILIGGAISFFPIFLCVKSPGHKSTRLAVAIALPMMTALLIHITHGRIETHFHAFVGLIALAFYQERRLLLIATGIIVVDHVLRGLFWPDSVFGAFSSAPFLRSLEHGAWVIAEVVILSVSIHKMRTVIREQIKEAHAGQYLEEQVAKRTSELRDSEKRTRLAKDALEVERASVADKVDARTTELKEANAQLSQSVRMKDEFLANMSHELRTPLNSILGLSEAFSDGIYGQLTEKQTDRVQTIESSGRHLLDLINDILDVSKLDAGEMTLDLSEFKISDIVESGLSFVKLQASRKNIDLKSSIDPEITTIVADNRRLKQLLVNLLSNAVKFTEEGSITVDVRKDPYSDHLQLSVTDTGVGIDQRDFDKLFTPFVQVDSSLSRSHDGTGLGLTLVQQMAELHSGTVSVTSEVGKGSCFTVSIPMDQKLPSVSDKTEGTDRTGDLNDKAIQTAIVIEDSEIAAEQIERYLAEIDIECSIYETGEAALDRLNHTIPDLIVLDVQLPGIWGWSVLEKLKEDPRTENIPVIIVSVIDDRVKALELGADAYLIKPVTRMEMNQALSKAVELAHKPIASAFVTTAKDEDEPSNQRVLIADDNEANVEVLADYLEMEGYQLSFAKDGQEALDKCASEHPDIVLMDIQMPGMDGLTAIERMKRDRQLSGIPIIAVTALAMAGDRERCLEAGADDYISKPIKMRLLIESIRTLLKEQDDKLALAS